VESCFYGTERQRPQRKPEHRPPKQGGNKRTKNIWKFEAEQNQFDGKGNRGIRIRTTNGGGLRNKSAGIKSGVLKERHKFRGVGEGKPKGQDGGVVGEGLG